MELDQAKLDEVREELTEREKFFDALGAETFNLALQVEEKREGSRVTGRERETPRTRSALEVTIQELEADLELFKTQSDLELDCREDDPPADRIPGKEAGAPSASRRCSAGWSASRAEADSIARVSGSCCRARRTNRYHAGSTHRARHWGDNGPESRPQCDSNRRPSLKPRGRWNERSWRCRRRSRRSSSTSSAGSLCSSRSSSNPCFWMRLSDSAENLDEALQVGRRERRRRQHVGADAGRHRVTPARSLDGRGRVVTESQIKSRSDRSISAHSKSAWKTAERGGAWSPPRSKRGERR